MVEDKRYHHIFDPMTGYPVDNELVVVQIYSDDVVGVDAISTMLFVMGLEEAMKYIESRDDIEGILITYNKEIYLSSGFGEYEIVNNEYKFKTL